MSSANPYTLAEFLEDGRATTDEWPIARLRATVEALEQKRVEIARLRAEVERLRLEVSPGWRGQHWQTRGELEAEVERLKAAHVESQRAGAEEAIARRKAEAEVKERQKALEVAIEERESALVERNWANERWEEQRAEVERLRGLILGVERAPNAPNACPWCRCGGWHESDCPAFSALGKVRGGDDES